MVEGREGCAEEAASASFQPCELRQGASLLQDSHFLSVKWEARDPYTVISRCSCIKTSCVKVGLCRGGVRSRNR